MAPSDSRERILSSASELFRRHGYQATSWRQIVDHGDAPWGSIAFLFPGGKTQLGAEAVARLGRETDARLRQVFFDPTDVTRSLVAFVKASTDQLEESDWELGSPLATIALEMAHRDDDIGAACIHAYDLWVQTLAELCTPQLGERAAAELAGVFLSAWEGALLRARTQRSRVPLDELAAATPRLVKMVEGAAPRTPDNE
ncbi:MAG: TetR family transcriptional regulator [Actinomycetia bacterium]|nr:TetR family transcriptional regulator [Actinomycetes bacterium]